MFGWSGPQRASPITLFCLLLIISIQTNATVPSNMDSAKKRPVSLPVKQVATWRRGPESKLNVRRLYDAYKQRLKLQDDRDDHAKGVRSAAGSARNTNHAHKEQRLKVVKLMISPTRYDATDERQNEDNNNMSPKKTTDVEDEQNDREKPDVKHPVVSGMMILKVDMPTPNPDPKPIQMPLGLSQLIHLYDEYTKSWRQPSGELKPMPVYEEASNAEPIITESAPNALHKLFNVLQHLELDPDALKINRPPQPSNNRESAGPSDRNEAPHRDDFNVLLHRLEPKLSSNIFKRVTDEIGAIRSHIKAGGLYDEYKKRLCQILRDQKNTRNIKSDDSGITSESDMPIDSENSRKTNSVNDCWCDASKPAKFATEKAHAVARLFAKDKMLRKNKPVSNVKGKPQNGYAKALDAFAFCGADACKGNGGQKPYYLPNSKNRQLVWNEVPLLKKGDSSSNSSRLNAVNTTDGSTFVGPVAGPTADGGTSGFGLKFKSKTGERPTFSNLPSKPYSGLDPAHIRTAIHNFRNTSFFSLYDEYQKQIDNLHKVLKSKQNWWNEAQNWTSNGGAIPAEVFPADTEASSEHNHIPSSLAQLEEGVGISNNNHMVFPDVLTQALASSMNVLSPGPITGSGGVLENMATQLNLSPVELAQRIANVGQTGDTRILRNEMLAPNAGPAPNSMPQSASSTSAARMPAVSPMPAINVPVKLAENAIDTTQSSNLAPILDKILQRLQTMQQAKLEETTEDAVAVAPTTDKPLPCCFADPTDGAPCDLIGSWESLLLGVRINIKDTREKAEDDYKPTCAQPKYRRFSAGRFSRQCVKINSSQIRELSEAKAVDNAVSLNISIQETVPPRAHDIIENVTEWSFTGHTLSALGGPLSLSCRKIDSNLIGTFVGYCRTCGCVDTIFGSWTFCTPSHDCQDITTSIFERRDMLRRYNMDSKRKDRFKEQLYKKSKFAKAEKDRLLAEQKKMSRKG